MLFNPNYPEVFSKQVILGGGAIIIPPKIDHVNPTSHRVSDYVAPMGGA